MTVEEYLKFVAELKQIPKKDRAAAIEAAVEKTGIKEVYGRLIRNLSKGYKQRVGIAQAIVDMPEIIILDEPTSMLDPYGRLKILDTLRTLNKEEKISIILVTQLMREAFEADRVLVMNKGNLVFDGNPQKLFSNREKLKKYSLDVPIIGIISEKLKKMGIKVSKDSMTSESLASEIVRLYNQKKK